MAFILLLLNQHEQQQHQRQLLTISNEHQYEVQPIVLQYKIADHDVIICAISKLAGTYPKETVQKAFDLKTFN